MYAKHYSPPYRHTRRAQRARQAVPTVTVHSSAINAARVCVSTYIILNDFMYIYACTATAHIQLSCVCSDNVQFCVKVGDEKRFAVPCFSTHCRLFSSLGKLE